MFQVRLRNWKRRREERMWLNLVTGSSLKQNVYHRPFDTSVEETEAGNHE